jgi:4a-hydroxytetrahydrobiopterin dehydratase
MEKEILVAKRCTPCSIGAEPLSAQEIPPLLKELDGWVVVGEKSIEKTFHFKDFSKPLILLNAIAFIAESQGHHPDLELSWGRLFVRLYTHKIEGLSLNDFIVAKKIDELVKVSS